MNKRILSILLAALMLSSSLSLTALADDPTEPAPDTDVTEPAETPETENPETETPETEELETEIPETETPETAEPEQPVPEEPAETEPEDTEPPAPETTPPETTVPETTPPADTPQEPEKEEPKVEQSYTITVGHHLMESGMVMPNRRTAKEGEVVILRVFEKEFEQRGKNYKYEFRGWYSDADIQIIHVSRTMAFFYMPAEDVTVTPLFRTVDVTEYYDWDAVEEDVRDLHRNESLEVDMEEEVTIPHDVLKALAGKDADVTFTTEDCIYTIHGEDITLNSESEDGYKLTYKDYELTKILRRKLRNTDLLSVKVTADSDHDITAELRCFASRDVDTGYLYRLMGNGFEYVSTVSIRNGDARIPVSESGVYVVTSQALADVTMGINVNSENVVPIVGGKLIPLSATVDGKLVFRTESYGKLMFSEYTSSYTDIRNHKYKNQIDFVCARGLLDGVDADSFQPNAGITTGEFMRAIARLRGIPDKDAYDYCTQLDIFTYEYVENDLLSRNEMSVIFTNFINHLIQYPKSFGGYSMSGFDDNGAAWVGARFRELKNNSAVEYNWKENASRAEAAYLLQAAVETIITGDYSK